MSIASPETKIRKNKGGVRETTAAAKPTGRGVVNCQTIGKALQPLVSFMYWLTYST